MELVAEEESVAIIVKYTIKLEHASNDNKKFLLYNTKWDTHWEIILWMILDSLNRLFFSPFQPSLHVVWVDEEL